MDPLKIRVVLDVGTVPCWKSTFQIKQDNVSRVKCLITSKEGKLGTSQAYILVLLLTRLTKL